MLEISYLSLLSLLFSPWIFIHLSFLRICYKKKNFMSRNFRLIFQKRGD